MMPVTLDDMHYVARLVDELCGVVLDDTKGYLVESRLSRLAQEQGCKSYRELCDKARSGGNRALQQKVIDAITTQETLFFRDGGPFDALQHKVIPDMIDACNRSGCKRLRLWSAACSTGQEPYSIAMVLRETIPDIRSWNITLLATDVSDAAIARASRGAFPAHEIDRGMRAALLSKYFAPRNGEWQVKDELRAIVTFQRRDLLQPFPELGTFDVIFCRNVAIYFDAARRLSLFRRLAERLSPAGALFIGSSESLLDCSAFAPTHHCRTTFYQTTSKPAGELPARSQNFGAVSRGLATAAIGRNG